MKLKLRIIAQRATLAVCAFLLLSCSKNDPEKDQTPPNTGGGSGTMDVTDWTTPVSKGPKYYVSAKNGDDKNSADAAQNPKTPWATIQKAASAMAGGGTVFISGGVYKEKIVIPITASGTSSSQTIFTNLDKEEVIIEGGITDSNASVSRFVSQVLIDDASYVTIKGIKVQNVSWYGITSDDNGKGNATNNTIENCTITNSGASGIYVRNGTNMYAIANKITKACQVLSRKDGLGTQECITFAGIDGFRISYNEVADSDVSDAAGGEGIDTKGGTRNGEISKNYVHDIKALGLYVDAGSFGSGLACGTGASKPPVSNIRVHANRVYRTNGVRVAAEMGGHADNIYFYNNIIKESIKSGFVFNVPGKYECNGTVFPNSEVGKFTNIYIVNNTFYNDGVTATSGNFVGSIISFNNNPGNDNIVVKNNIIYSATTAKLSISIREKKGFVVGNNLFFNFKPALNFSAIVKDVDFEGDPLFKNPDANDFSLQPTSPAKGKGTPIVVNGAVLFNTDSNGNPRGSSSWDLGAF